MAEAMVAGEQNGAGEVKVLDSTLLLLAELPAKERERAWQRYLLLSPYLYGKVSLAEVARSHSMSLKTLEGWLSRYRRGSLIGLARRRRSDQGVRRLISPECQQVIEGLALTPPRCSIAEIHRKVSDLAKRRGWPEMSYSSVYAIVRAIDPALQVLAHEGSRVYQELYDLLFLQEVKRPNERWQADHCLLNIWLLDEQGKARRAWLTIILDDFSRAIMGYRLSFDAPSAYQTGLTLRQAILGKQDERWPMWGLPEILYTDHGSDFTSKHLEQVVGQLSIQLIFSQVGRPRGRGKGERAFRTVKQQVLPGLPGYISPVRRSYRSARKRRGKAMAEARLVKRQACMTLSEFDTTFRTWLLEIYHHRKQVRLHGTPLARWQEGKWLPRPPKSERDLDLLLLYEGKTRQVQQEGIRFQGHWYMDVKLSRYVRSTVRIYYDPADLRTITVYTPDGITGGQFLCQARCQDIEEQKVSLKEIVAARTQRRKELQTDLHERQRAARQVRASSSRKTSASGTSGEKVLVSGESSDGSQPPTPPLSRFKSSHFMAQLSPEFVPGGAPSQQSETKAASSARMPTGIPSPEERTVKEPSSAKEPTRTTSSAKVPVSGESSAGSQSPTLPLSRFKPPRFMARLSPEFVQKK
jgi:putative transposase